MQNPLIHLNCQEPTKCLDSLHKQNVTGQKSCKYEGRLCFAFAEMIEGGSFYLHNLVILIEEVEMGVQNSQLFSVMIRRHGFLGVERGRGSNTYLTPSPLTGYEADTI